MRPGPKALGWALIAMALLLTACGREDESATGSRQMPPGYEPVDAAFGVRSERLVHEDGGYTVPVVEFRTGGDYALYPVTTACEGSFSRGAGTIFSRNGTVKGDVAAQASQALAANPQFEALLERICAAVLDSRFVADPFQPRAALELLLGSLDSDDEAAWMPDAGSGVEEGLKYVSLRRSGAFAQGDERWSYILTGARDLGCRARACGGGAIGGALFRFDGGKWRLASHAPVILSAGANGEAVGGDSIRNLHGEERPPLIRVDWGDCHMGQCGMSTSLIGVVEGRLAEVWSASTGAGSLGTTACADPGQCTDWTADISLLDNSGAAFPDIEMARKGHEWDWQSEKLFEVDEKLVYRYDPVGSYHEASRSGGRVEVPLPLAAAGQDREFMEDRSAASHATAPVSPPGGHDERQAGPRLPDSEAHVDLASRSMNPPRYPPAALRSGITGQVVMVVSVDAQGNVTDVEVERSSRSRDLDRAAIQAARKWRFNPAVEGGRPVSGQVRVPVDFDLD